MVCALCGDRLSGNLDINRYRRPALFWAFVAISLFLFARDIQKAQVLDRLVERMRREEC
jgi:hypothetical protein